MRVLLVDADMRRPRVHEIFDLQQEPGLSNLLTGNARASETIQKSPVPGLWLMPAGHIPPNPAELLSSPRFVDFLGALEDHFDWVVLDTPPVLVVTDSVIVGNRATGVAFVVGADQTSRHAARNALDQLTGANVTVIGAILNRADVKRHSHYYASYYSKGLRALLREAVVVTPRAAALPDPTAAMGGAERVLLDLLTQLRRVRRTGRFDSSSATMVHLLLMPSAWVSTPSVCHSLATSLVWVMPVSPRRARMQFARYAVRGSVTTVRYLRTLRRMIATFAPDVVHSNGIKMHLLAAVARSQPDRHSSGISTTTRARGR